jgi:hypothetical protein
MVVQCGVCKGFKEWYAPSSVTVRLPSDTDGNVEGVAMSDCIHCEIHGLLDFGFEGLGWVFGRVRRRRG